MDAAVIIALMALAGSIFSTLATVFGTPVLQARREARAVLARHREPLLAEAYELQSRLRNILCNRFVEDYVLEAKARKQDAALESTLYVARFGPPAECPQRHRRRGFPAGQRRG